MMVISGGEEEARDTLGHEPKTGQLLDLSSRSLDRVFNGWFDRGGRIYGACWQGRAPRRGVGEPVLGGSEGDQAATADSLRRGSSLKLASDSRLM